MNVFDILKDSQIFAGIDLNEVSAVADLCELKIFQKDEIVFNEGDPGDSLFLVNSGEIKIFKSITSHYEETLVRLGKGSVFGEMSFVDRMSRSTSAVALERSELLSLSRERFDRLIEKDPALGAEVMKRLSEIICQRIRTTNEKYKATVLWYLEITGLTYLSPYYLIENRIEVEIGFDRETALKGRIINAGKGETGYEVTLKDFMDRLYFIPYHAINYISFESNAIHSTTSSGYLATGGIL